MDNLNDKTLKETQEIGYLHFLNLVVNGEPRKEYLSEMREMQNRFDDLYLWTSGCDSIEDC